MNKILKIFFFCLIFTPLIAQKSNKITIYTDGKSGVRQAFGIEKLSESLRSFGYQIKISTNDFSQAQNNDIVIRKNGENLLKIYSADTLLIKKKESYLIQKTDKKPFQLIGKDDSGVLYACLDLANRIKENKKIPQELSVTEVPEMVLRGTCVGLQKPKLLPDREVYEYPYTPESFPWFYDKALWLKYLDMMVENRYNSLYLWNGHPFASLVKLKDYPYAVEVDEATFQKNEEMYRFLTQEADKRGIWVIQMFYNIIVSKPFAEHHKIKTQDRNRPIIPLIADYTRKSIAAFVEKYPNVGLLITLGEAMEGAGQDDVDWFTKTIIPGVQDGLKAIHSNNEPPIVLRAHDSDAPRVMKDALPLYKNLYTMAKYNGEALTTYTPRGSWAELHRKLSRIGTVHVENVHLLSNLEPFRYSSPDFIQKSVQAMHNVYEANALHLYPQASYWDWPYTADKTSQRILQLDRDEMWYKTWARYAWKSNRERNEEEVFWQNHIAKKFGLNENQAKKVLLAYEETGEIAPKLLRRYGITDGNRQTLTLGMLMTQLINPYRYSLLNLLYESEAPEGEKIIDYAEKDWKGEKHIGETPLQIAEEVKKHAQKALDAINSIDSQSVKDKAEFERLKNDVRCYHAMANFYAEKALASLDILRFKYSNNVHDLEKALPRLEESVKHYSTLTNLTKDAYLYANSMQTKQRKIPMRGVDATFIHWKEMLPVFQKELNRFKFCIDSLHHVKSDKKAEIQYLKPAEISFISKIDGQYLSEKGQTLLSDTSLIINEIAPELKFLKGVQFSKNKQILEGTKLEFSCKIPVKVLVGYFNESQQMYSAKKSIFLPKPQLEIDASANNYGQSEAKITNALLAGNWGSVNIHTYTFEAGANTLTLGKGVALVLGFVEGKQDLKVFDAGLAGNAKNIDWLFE
ncbi:alpha-d-galacturonidase [Arcicella aurantiaca]|nr:hypothetical protein [Arcicella aurantiaca]